MKILKFGGTSVGSPQRMKDVCKLIHDGEQKIVKGSTNSTLPATCAYFTNSGTMEDAYAIRLEGEEITGINAINNGVAEDGAVYNLQGVKVSDTSMKNLPAGLYIMNGKKFIIK